MSYFSEVHGYGRAMGRYATFAGRSTRSEFWYFTLVSCVMGLGAALIDDAARIGDVLYLLVTLVHLIPSLSVFTRRMHDTGRSGWWFWLLFTVVGLIPVLVFLCQRGTPGVNRYGQPSGAPEGLAGPYATLPGGGDPSAASRDAIGELERLAELHGKGALSDAEFARLKAQVLGPAEVGRLEPRF